MTPLGQLKPTNQIAITRVSLVAFAKLLKKKKLLCSGGVTAIKGLKEAALPQKVKSCVLILMLKIVAYILNFLLNLVLLPTLEDKSFRWHHWTEKIRNKKSQIIGSTVRQGKNYKINNLSLIIRIMLTKQAITKKFWLGYTAGCGRNNQFKNSHLYTTYATFATRKPNNHSRQMFKRVEIAPICKFRAFNKEHCFLHGFSAWTHQQLHAPALPNIWHQ